MDDEETYRSYVDTDSDDDIVISGIAGRFPASDNMKQLQENLFKKINLLEPYSRRLNTNHPDLPKRMGIINNIEKFDADFFDVSFKQAHSLDPMTRMLLEHTYEAIIDAGINPKQLRGKNTAVIIGTSYLESQEKFLYENLKMSDENIIGCSKSTTANMLSYIFNLKGPSHTVDTACSSSLYAIACAYDCIISGQSEDAIVGATNLCLHPIINLQFTRLGVLSSDGYCRPFDTAASGYSRSETVSVIYLQKAKNAKRIYAICKHIKLKNDGYKEEGITYPSSFIQRSLLTEFYNECEVPPSYLDYIETHGTATRAGDPEEINAIHSVLCKNRKTPLMLGSVKSNLGHAEPASGVVQIAKVIIAFETGFIPPNINFTSPRDDIDALADGTIRIITEATPLKNGYVAVSSFGFGGADAHMLLKWNPKKKVNSTSTDDLPRLVALSGRTEESVKLFLNDIANQPIDVEYIRLLHDIYADNIDGHSWRGYTILDTRQKISIKKVQNFKNIRRPICFIFSALGSQWLEMGKELLKFHAFANAVKMCDAILKPYDINITGILTKIDRRLNKSVLHNFVGIIAFQIGLVDLLTCLNIIPDYMIGHSAGELVCAYADGCLTIEQTILSAYFIGLACSKGKPVCNSMITVNLDYNDLKSICPTDIEIIYRNSRKSNIVSGPVKSIGKFIQKLQDINIDVKEISCNNVPYHSRHLAFVETQLLLNLNKIIPQPKERSSKWISTSVPRKEWSNPASKICSASYHTSSILNTVLFEQTTHIIPDNAVILEIVPDSILQDILKESLYANVTNIILTKQNELNAIDSVLQGIGQLYNYGLQPQIANLYPPVKFPVSRGTPMISPSIRWNHSEDWFVKNYEMHIHIKDSGERQVEIKTEDEDYSYMTGHVIDGRNLLPATGYLVHVWETIGMIKGTTHTSLPIIFRDVKFIRATHLSKDVPVNLTIAIQKESGKFEVTEGESIVVTGVVHATSNPEQEMVPNNLLSTDNDKEEHMNSRDIYKELRLRGYQYSGGFCGLNSASVTGSKGHIAWTDNWVTFMDNMLQMYIIGKDTRDLYVPTSIQKLVINPELHISKLKDVTFEKNKQVPIHVNKKIDVIKSGGIEIRGLKATSISRRKPIGDPVIEEHKFVAHQDCANILLNEAIRISVQLALEDHQILKVTAIELVEDVDNVMIEDLSSTLLIEAFADIPLIQANVAVLTSPNRFNPTELSSNVSIAHLNKPFAGDKALIATGYNLLTKHQNSLEQLLPLLREGGFLLTREKCTVNNYNKYLQTYKLNVILEKHTDKEMIILLKKKVPIKKRTVVHINNNNFNWLENLKPLVDENNKHDDDSRIVIVGEGDLKCGLLGFINCLRKEPGGELVRGVLIQDEMAPKFSLQDPFYMQQLQKDMTINVLRPNKTWGSYRHLRLLHPEVKSVPTAYVCQTVPGDLSTLCWVENNISIDSHREDIVRVIYSSLNFKDVMLATGKLTSDIGMSSGRLQSMTLGFEYVGFDANGQRVMGLRDNKCIANVIIKDKDLCWKIPDTWTFEQAATVPCIYSTNYYALYHFGKMKKGDKVLIHSGTGGIGQSAIHLALQEGCQVFITVGTAEKREFIRKLFPAIPDEHIGNSRDTSFEQMIMRQTNGRGVDIVLNSLAEEKLIASVRCLAKGGRFLEIGKFDMFSNNPLSMSLIKKSISFYPVLLDAMFTDNNHKYKSRLSKLMAEGLKNGNIKPIQTTVFSKAEIETAFRYMASGKHTGKIILNIQEDGKSLDSSIVAHRRYYCLSDKTYIILGGLGGFGLELTDWLILRGAKNVILTSRTGIKNGYQRMKIELWKSYGVNVKIVKDANLANPEECEHFLKMAEKQGPVDAIFNLAVVLKDCVFKNQTMETFAESFMSKAWTTQTLDKLSRKICLKLRHFVVFSSVSCGRGNAGQTNYGMANSIMERVCEKRTEEGLPGLAIQWGAVGDVGLVADMQEDNKELVIGGTLQQKISSCLVELEKFLLQNRPIVSSMIVNEKKTGLFGSNMVEVVANIMNIKDIKVISQNTSLAELGMDSMMAVEIRQTLEREFNVLFSAQETRNLTFSKLNEISNTNVNSNDTQTKEATDINKQDLEKERILLFGVVKNEDFVSEICLDFPTNSKNNSTHVFFLPGIEGCGSIFNKLASNIKFSATSLQYANIGAVNTISEMADYFLMCILSRLKDKKKVVLVGYSFGSILAIELIRRLETTNIKSQLILIDGAPEYIKVVTERYTPSCMSDEELQISIMIIIIKIYEAKITEEVLLDLKKCKSWEKFETFAKYFLKVNSFLSRPNLQTLYTTIYKLIKAVQQYDSSILPRIKSPVTLLKPTLSYAPELEEDYGLYKIIENKVVVHHVESNHATILANEKVAAVINEETM